MPHIAAKSLEKIATASDVAHNRRACASGILLMRYAGVRVRTPIDYEHLKSKMAPRSERYLARKRVSRMGFLCHGRSPLWGLLGRLHGYIISSIAEEHKRKSIGAKQPSLPHASTASGNLIARRLPILRHRPKDRAHARRDWLRRRGKLHPSRADELNARGR